MRKSKGQTIDLLYTNKKDTSKKTKNKPNKSKSTAKKKNTKTKKVQNNNNDIINLDNEIIIGLTRKKEDEKNQKNKKTKKTNNKGKNNKKLKPKTKKTNSKSTLKKQNSKNKRKTGIIKWMILCLILLIVILFVWYFVLSRISNLFVVKEIVVVNNNKVPSEEIINLSTLTSGINMFKTSNKTIEEGIKTNAYVEEVNVKRNIKGIVTLDIKERVATYMLKFANAYVYINNQGYMLEISENPLEVPMITGFSTINEEIKPGNRLNTEDLQKLDDVIKIIETSKNTPLANIITEVDISNSTNYKLTITSQSKTIKIGEFTNINIKLQMAGKVLEAESGKAGEIYFQDNGKKAIFKEDVAR